LFFNFFPTQNEKSLLQPNESLLFNTKMNSLFQTNHCFKQIIVFKQIIANNSHNRSRRTTHRDPPPPPQAHARTVPETETTEHWPELHRRRTNTRQQVGVVELCGVVWSCVELWYFVCSIFFQLLHCGCGCIVVVWFQGRLVF